METTIQVSKKLVETLKKRKLNDNETYEDVIWDLIEDTMEINEQTKKGIEKALSQVKSGKYYTHDQVKKKLKLDV